MTPSCKVRDGSSLLGIGSSASALLFWLRAPAKGDFLLQHISGMGASCIATVTAFLVVNAPRLGVPNSNLLVWVTPGVIGGFAFGRTLRKYRESRPSKPATEGALSAR